MSIPFCSGFYSILRVVSIASTLKDFGINNFVNTHLYFLFFMLSLSVPHIYLSNTIVVFFFYVDEKLLHIPSKFFSSLKELLLSMSTRNSCISFFFYVRVLLSSLKKSRINSFSWLNYRFFQMIKLWRNYEINYLITYF